MVQDLALHVNISQMASERLPPAQPTYVLRGHASQIHAVCFYSANARLLTADADGWVVSWSLAYKRPEAVWRAHGNAVLGLATWGDRIITHGRDNKLVIWQLTLADEISLDKSLPVNDPQSTRAQPWILHMLDVNALNFCAFAICTDMRENVPKPTAREIVLKKEKITEHDPILIALPHTLDSDGIDIFHFPSETRLSTIPPEKTIKTGMVMALAIHSTSTSILIAAGYESGHTFLYHRPTTSSWQKIYSSQPHSQPVLSLSISPQLNYFLTSSADAVIAKHPFSTNHSLHPSSEMNKPLKTIQTKHSGQQGLHIRSDGKVFSTAGWDSKVRVYSAKTMRETAVLKWHRDGCFATAFAEISLKGISTEENNGGKSQSSDSSNNGTGTSLAGTLSVLPTSQSKVIMSGPMDMTVQQRRDLKAQSTHWLAAGSKDGRISLWDIY